MKELTKLMVDPPYGWKYGFPKLYEPMKDGSLHEWLVREGYPPGELTPTTPVRFTPIED